MIIRKFAGIEEGQGDFRNTNISALIRRDDCDFRDDYWTVLVADPRPFANRYRPAAQKRLVPWVVYNNRRLTPGEARDLAAMLIEAANIAEDKA